MNKNLTDEILQNFYISYLNEELTDIHLICWEKVFKTHLAIIYASCNYFSERIDQTYKETNDKITFPLSIHVDEISPIMLESVLQFIYTGQLIGLSWIDVYDTLNASKALKFDSLMHLCYNFIKNNLSCSSLCQTYRFSIENEIENVLNLTLKFIAHNFLELFQSGILNDFCYEEFNSLISDQRLLIKKAQIYYCDSMYEDSILKCIKAWVHLDSEREQYENDLESNVKSTLQLYTNNFKIYSVPYSMPCFLNRAYGNHWDIDLYDNNPRFCTCSNFPPNEWFIKGMIFFIIPNWEDRNVIAGINVIYKNRTTKEEEIYKCFPEESNIYQIETMMLEDDERIHSLTLSHGWMLYSVTIGTSLDRLFGPYGSTSDDVESYLNLRRQTPLGLWMHGFSYVPCKINDVMYINKVKICVATLDRKQYVDDFVDILPTLEIERLDRLNRVDSRHLPRVNSADRLITGLAEQWDRIPTLRERPRTAIGNVFEIANINEAPAQNRRNSIISPVLNMINRVMRRFND